MNRELLLNYLQLQNDVENIDHQTEEGVAKHFYASDLLLCKRMRYFKRTPGIEKTELPPAMLIRFDQGHQWEDRWELILKQEGRFIDREVRVEVPEWEMSGRADFIQLDDIGRPGVVELKTCHPFAPVFNPKSPEYGKEFEHHKAQVRIYYNLLKKKYNLQWFGIFYISIADARTEEFNYSQENEPMFKSFDEKIKRDSEELLLDFKIKKLPPPLPKCANRKGIVGFNWQCWRGNKPACDYFCHNCREDIV